MKNNIVVVAVTTALAGGIFLLAGIALSVKSYNSLHAEHYSFINHFVSELGWGKASNAALFFNWGLFAGSVALLPVMYAVGRRAGSCLGYIAMICGSITLLAGSSAGIFPLDDFKPHILAALVFLWAYLLTVVLFSLAFCPCWNKTPSIPMVVVGIICSVLALVFLAFPKDSLINAVRDLRGFQRPRIWWLAILEWGVFASVWLWSLTAIVVLWRNGSVRDDRQ